jgi:hypothetical protein
MQRVASCVCSIPVSAGTDAVTPVTAASCSTPPVGQYALQGEAALLDDVAVAAAAAPTTAAAIGAASAHTDASHEL